MLHPNLEPISVCDSMCENYAKILTGLASRPMQNPRTQFRVHFQSYFLCQNQGWSRTCILQNLLQCITFIFEAALIVHHATVTKTSWSWACSLSDSAIKAHIRKEHFIWMSRVPGEKAPPKEPPFPCKWMITKTSLRSPWAAFFAGSMFVRVWLNQGILFH